MTDWIKLRELSHAVEKYSPMLVELITPFNPAVARIVTLIAQACGGDPSDPADVAARVAADPDAEAKLKQIAAQEQENMYRSEVEDRESARGREIEKERLLGREDWMLDFIAIVVVIGFFGMCFVVAFQKMDQSDHDILYMLIGQLTAGFIMVVSYYFGSSNKK